MYLYELIDLGPHVIPHAINNHGLVACNTGDSGGTWKNGVLTPLPKLPAALSHGQPYGINNQDVVVGWYNLGPSTMPNALAIRWQGNAPSLIETGIYSVARDINDYGDIVGSHEEVPGSFEEVPVLWKQGVGYTLPGGRGEALAINNHGVAAGHLTHPYFGGGYGRPFLWEAGARRALKLPYNYRGIANAINDSGIAVGWAYPDAATQARKPWIWPPNTGWTLPMPPGARGGEANDINVYGLVVGKIVTPTWAPHPVSWFGTILTDLTQVISRPANFEILEARCVNDQGWIGGTGHIPGPYDELPNPTINGWVARPLTPRGWAVPPQAWSMLLGMQCDGPGVVVTGKGPVRVPPWTPYLKTLPKGFSNLVTALLDANVALIRKQRKARKASPTS